MANSKNTIQNIPLLGQLNLNTLKTEVKPFQGYNEKNSTVFGGELGPIYNKQKLVTYRDASEDKRVILNSKGKEYTLYEGGFTDPSGTNYTVERSLRTFKLDVPEECISSYLHVYNDGEILIEFYISTAYKIYYRLFQNTESLKLKDAFAELEKLEWIEGFSSSSLSNDLLNGDAYFAPQRMTFDATLQKEIQYPRILIAMWGQQIDYSNNNTFCSFQCVTFDFSDLENIQFLGATSALSAIGKLGCASSARVTYGYEYASKETSITITGRNNTSVSGNQTVLMTSADRHYIFQFMSFIGEAKLSDLALDLPEIIDLYINENTWQIDNSVTLSLSPDTIGNMFYETIDGYSFRYSVASFTETMTFPFCRGRNNELLFTYDNYYIGDLGHFDASSPHLIYFGLKGYLCLGFVLNNDNTIQRPYSLRLFDNMTSGHVSYKYDITFNLNQYTGIATYSSPISARKNESTGVWSDVGIESTSYFTDSDTFALVRGSISFEPTDIMNVNKINVLSGHDGEGFIPTPIGYNINYYASEFYKGSTNNNLWMQGKSIFYQSGNIMSVSYNGIPICEPNTIYNTTLSCTYYSGTYHQFDTGWYSYYYEKNAVPNILCNRYICRKSESKKAAVFDIESNSIVDYSIYLGYISTLFPVLYAGHSTCPVGNYKYVFPIVSNKISEVYISKYLTGAQFGAGYNVLYNLKNSNLTGYTPNQYIMTHSIHADSATARGEVLDYSKINSALQQQNGSLPRYAIDIFASFGNQVLTAEYVGELSYLSGTVYPINADDNIVLPISYDSTLIKGYANNDLIKNTISNHTYPLVYSNLSTPIYAYYQMSMLNTAEGSFTLQTNTYIFDSTYIYSVVYSGGMIANVQNAAYKANLEYLGSLPSRAIFYSSFNKALYQFTGDGIISKMLDASDIDEILYVGQNPATMSIWICTDKGILIISDNDMYRLEIIASNVYFYKNMASIIYEKDDKEVPEQIDIMRSDISLYDLGNEAEEIPVRLKTCFYGLGSELKANYDCWYIRLHSKNRKEGNLTMKINTITDKGFETEEKPEHIEPSKYDSNDMIYIKYQPKYQSAVAMQLELESDIPIYQVSLGVNTADAVTQTAKFNF